jgi:hypothetical protein
MGDENMGQEASGPRLFLFFSHSIHCSIPLGAKGLLTEYLFPLRKIYE